MPVESIPLKLLSEGEHPERDARIVKAAIRFGDLVYTGWRHSVIMEHVHARGKAYTTQEDQGFVDQYGNFHNRWRSGQIAARARQAPFRHGTLLSEQVWDNQGKPRDPSKPYDPSKD